MSEENNYLIYTIMIIKTGSPVKNLHSFQQKYTLLDDWIWQDKGFCLKVRAGFQTDLATIPDVFFFWEHGQQDFAAIAHDYLYKYGRIEAIHAKGASWMYLTKKEADRLFYDLMCTQLHFMFKQGYIGQFTLRRRLIDSWLMWKAVELIGGRQLDGSNSYGYYLKK